MNRNLLRIVAVLLVPCLMMDPITVMASIGPVGAGFHPRPQSEFDSIQSIQIAGRRGSLPLQFPFTSQALASRYLFGRSSRVRAGYLSRVTLGLALGGMLAAGTTLAQVQPARRTSDRDSEISKITEVLTAYQMDPKGPGGRRIIEAVEDYGDFADVILKMGPEDRDAAFDALQAYQSSDKKLMKDVRRVLKRLESAGMRSLPTQSMPEDARAGKNAPSTPNADLHQRPIPGQAPTSSTLGAAGRATKNVPRAARSRGTAFVLSLILSALHYLLVWVASWLLQKIMHDPFQTFRRGRIGLIGIFAVLAGTFVMGPLTSHAVSNLMDIQVSFWPALLTVTLTVPVVIGSFLLLTGQRGFLETREKAAIMIGAALVLLGLWVALPLLAALMVGMAIEHIPRGPAGPAGMNPYGYSARTHAAAIARGDYREAHRILVEDVSLEELIFLEPLRAVLQEADLWLGDPAELTRRLFEAYEDGLDWFLDVHREKVWEDGRFVPTRPRHLKQLTRLYCDMSLHMIDVVFRHVTRAPLDGERDIREQLQEILYESDWPSQQAARDVHAYRNDRSDRAKHKAAAMAAPDEPAPDPAFPPPSAAPAAENAEPSAEPRDANSITKDSALSTRPSELTSAPASSDDLKREMGSLIEFHSEEAINAAVQQLGMVFGEEAPNLLSRWGYFVDYVVKKKAVPQTKDELATEFMGLVETFERVLAQPGITALLLTTIAEDLMQVGTSFKFVATALGQMNVVRALIGRLLAASHLHNRLLARVA